MTADLLGSRTLALVFLASGLFSQVTGCAASPTAIGKSPQAATHPDRQSIDGRRKCAVSIDVPGVKGPDGKEVNGFRVDVVCSIDCSQGKATIEEAALKGPPPTVPELVVEAENRALPAHPDPHSEHVAAMVSQCSEFAVTVLLTMEARFEEGEKPDEGIAHYRVEASAVLRARTRISSYLAQWDAQGSADQPHWTYSRVLEPVQSHKEWRGAVVAKELEGDCKTSVRRPDGARIGQWIPLDVTTKPIVSPGSSSGVANSND